MQAGDLRTKVRIQKQATTGTGSFATKTWIDIDNTSASDEPRYIPSCWEGLHGAEAWAASAEQAMIPATVTIRYRPDIVRSYRIVCDGINFDIVSANDPDKRRQWLEIKVRAAVNG